MDSKRRHVCRNHAVWLGAFAIASCGLDNRGIDPPPGKINFPVSVVLSQEAGAAPNFLFVANANFDLRYNAGTVQSFDLRALEPAVNACAGTKECTIATEPGASGASALVPPVGEVRIGAYSSAMRLDPAGKALYVTVRSNSDLSWIEVDPASGALNCGAAAPGQDCDSAHSEVDRSIAESKKKTFPTDPVGLHIASLREFGLEPGDARLLLMAHRGGAASLLVDFDDPAPPFLLDVQEQISEDLQNITFDPAFGIAWLPSGRRPQIARVGVGLDSETTDLSQAYLYDAGLLTVTGVDTGETTSGDTRALRLDPRPGSRKAYVISRRPEALLQVNRTGSGEGRLVVETIVDVGAGPSRLELVNLRTRMVALISCFDSRDIYLIDVDQGSVLGVVRGMSGPFEIAVDAQRERIYVADFRASAIRFIDLRPLLDCLDGGFGDCSPQILATLGVPRPVRELR